MRFKVIDATTGHKVSDETIKKIAEKCGMGNTSTIKFSLTEDGSILLTNGSTLESVLIDADKYNLMAVSDSRYPDIEYFETVFLGNIHRLHPEVFGNVTPWIELISSFTQIWPDTAGGFSEPGMITGSAMTPEITTVLQMHIYKSDKTYYAVFFGNRPAYIVEDANETFFEDLRKHSLKSRYDAEKVY